MAFSWLFTVRRYVGAQGFPSASRCSVSSFCHLMTSIGLTSHMRMFPKNGTSLSLMMYSLVIQVCSRIRGFTSEAYTSTKSENVMSIAPPCRLLNWLSHTAASTSVEKPRFVLWRFEPRASR